MFQPRPLMALMAVAFAAMSQPAWSLGFGRAQATAVLGSPFSLTLAIRTDASDALTSDCVQVQVQAGDSQIPRSALNVVLDTAADPAVLRVQTRQMIQEPVVSVQATLGCVSKVSRSYTFLVDPPGYLAAPVLAAAEPARVAPPSAPSPGSAVPSPTVPAVPAAASAPPTAAAPLSSTTVASQASSSADASAAATTPATPVAAAVAAPAAGSAVAAAKPPQPAKPKSAATAKTPSPKASAKAAPTDAAAPSAEAAAPRLKLDKALSTQRNLKAEALNAEREAALKAAEEAATTAQAAADLAQAKAASMDQALESLRKEARENREALSRLADALAQAESRSQAPPFWALAAMALLVLVTGGLAWQLRRVSRRQDMAWDQVGLPDHSPELDEPAGAAAPSAGSAASATGLPEIGTAQGLAQDVEPSSSVAPPAWPSTPSAVPAAVAPSPSLPAVSSSMTTATSVAPVAASTRDDEWPLSLGEKTQLSPPTGSSASAPMRGVSVDELLDLEQQVEFFSVLGQDAEAVGLLVEHLRKTGGTYPLPYLKLMEIHRRQGDSEAYERIRERFNQRFNAVAAAWGAAAQPVRHLDDYPEIIRQIVAAWARPLDAMALLETMLFRTEGGELLDMAALSDVLTLYILARELHEQAAGSADDVDVLLPFDDDAADAPSPSSAPALAAVPGVVAAAAVVPAALSQEEAASAWAPLSGLAGLDDLKEGPLSGLMGLDETGSIPPASASAGFAAPDMDLDLSGSSASGEESLDFDVSLGDQMLAPMSFGEPAAVPVKEPLAAPAPAMAMIDLPDLSPSAATQRPVSPPPASAMDAGGDDLDLDLGGGLMLDLPGLDAPATPPAKPSVSPSNASAQGMDAATSGIDFDIFGNLDLPMTDPKSRNDG